ncbi:MAG: hypothetical protein ABR614_01200 [Mycobacteriales bacterium]
MNLAARSRRRGLGLLLAGALATTACGSTVQSSGGPVAGGGAVSAGGGAAVGDGLGGPALPGAPGSADSATGPIGAVGAGSAGAAGGSALTGSGSGATDFGSTSGSAGAAPGAPGAAGSGAGPTSGGFVNGPGVTDTTIALGITICTDCDSINASFGAGGGDDEVDVRDYYKAAFDEISSRGGVLGRKLVPVYYEYSASRTYDEIEQGACEYFTKDHKVAVIFLRGELSYECAKKAGIVVVGFGDAGPVFDRYPNLFDPTGTRLERLGAATVKGMVQMAWQKPEPKWPTGKIGLITWEDNGYKYAIEKGWLPALKASGLKAEDVKYVAVPQGVKAAGDASAAVSSAVLSFRDQGIDHVFIADGPAGIFSGGGLTLLFLNNAKSQRYYPRYGFNSNNAPGNSIFPADQQSGMLAIDNFDGNRVNDEGIALNPQRERCYAIMKKRGLPAEDEQSSGGAARVACYYAGFTEAVFSRATAGTTLPSVLAAADSLGTSYRAPSSFGNRLERGRHDGATFFRNERYDDACSCMKYTSKPYEP